MKAKVTFRKPTGTITVAEQERSLRALGVSDAELRLWKAISDGVLDGDIISTAAQARYQSRSYITCAATSDFKVYVKEAHQTASSIAHSQTLLTFNQFHAEVGTPALDYRSEPLTVSGRDKRLSNTTQYALVA